MPTYGCETGAEASWLPVDDADPAGAPGAGPDCGRPPACAAPVAMAPASRVAVGRTGWKAGEGERGIGVLRRGWNQPRPPWLSREFPLCWTQWLDWLTNPCGACRGAGSEPAAPVQGSGRIAQLPR